MNQPIYCEQPIWGQFFEPVNTITNIFFILAGVLSILHLKKKGLLDAKGIFFSSLIILLGFGSIAWHTYRHKYTMMMDSLPIVLFVVIYVFFYIRAISKKLLHTILLFAGYFVYGKGLSIILSDFTDNAMLTNRGMEYFVVISYFALMQIYTYYNKRIVLKPSLIVFFVFLTSLFFRQLDLVVCGQNKFGTHFMWHILNAVALYLFVMLLYKEKLAHSHS